MAQQEGEFDRVRRPEVREPQEQVLAREWRRHPGGKALASRIALQELEVQLSGMTCPATVHNTGTVLHLGESY